jgi:hypothetical protein
MSSLSRDKWPKTIKVHGRETDFRWLMDHCLQYVRVDIEEKTDTPCWAHDCNGHLVHVYEVTKIRGVPTKSIFTKTKGGRKVSTKVHDSCSSAYCPIHGDWKQERLDKTDNLYKAYRAFHYRAMRKPKRGDNR